MKNKMLLSSLLVAGVIMTSGMNLSEAATTANQDVTATLGTCESVVANGTQLSANIDCNDGLGTLDQALLPGFLVTTNDSSSQAWYCNATTIAGTTPAMAYRAPNMYLALAQDTALAASVTSALQAGVPTPSANPDVIAYVTTLNDTIVTGTGTATITPGAAGWSIDLQNQGETQFDSSTSGDARTGTFSFDDSPGQYKANVLFSLGVLP